MKLFVKEKGRFAEVSSRPLRNEAELQRLLWQHSGLIPLDLDPRRQVVREFPTAAGPIDHLVVDALGSVTVVETKLASNTDRRAVIAQAIDYGAQLTKYGPQALLDKSRELAGDDFVEAWFETQGEREEFLRTLEQRLGQGRFTLLIVMDEAEARLKDAVRFLNRATHFNCLLAEVRLAEFEGKELVSVEVYGDETADEKPRSEPPIDPESFVKAKSKSGLGEEARAFLEVLAWAKQEGATTGPLSSGYYVAQSPFVANNYMGWYGDWNTLDIWATSEVFAQLKEHLEHSPDPWPQRSDLRDLNPGSRYGKAAKFTLSGASREEFRELFRHYLSGPKAEGTAKGP